MSKNDEVALEIEGQHNSIKLLKWDKEKGLRNPRLGAQWFHHAGLGLFLHWGISAVSGEFDLSWGMVTGWELAKKEVSPAEIEEMNRKKCYCSQGAEVTPNEYFKLAKDFNPDKYNPDEWIRLAKLAGFTYAVLTTKHHDGFALWNSNYGDFSTKNYLGGRDLVREYVDACHKYDMRVGFYYSPPDWYFNKDYMSYMIFTARRKNPGLPELDGNYNPMTMPSEEVMTAQNKRYGAYVKGQLDELLTNYGKIDLIWFDGSMPHGEVYPMERIRKLQPDIVVNPRMHGDGDFETCEVKETDSKPNGWWEFCTQWQEKGWAYLKGVNYRPIGKITTEFAKVLAWGGNYLLNIGPMADGSLPPQAINALAEFTEWSNYNRAAIEGVVPIDDSEFCSVPATTKENIRYLYLLPVEDQKSVVFKTQKKVMKASMLDDASVVTYDEKNGDIYYNAPLVKLESAVRIICVEMDD
ncbi:MAG: alpha-L-fucosidase [Oscillospiraceae bacterium]